MATISRAPVTRVGPLAPAHRERVEEITRATGVFSDAEVAVAVELFDEAMTAGPGTGDPGPDVISGGARSPIPDPGSRSSDVSSFTHPHELPPYVFLGAFTPDDDLVGYACYGATPDTDRVFDLYWIAVDPGTQGAGGGTTLLSEVERRLHDVNARMLVVETSSRSGYDATRRFYERRGYHEAARVRDFYAPSDDRVIYLKRFDARPGVRGWSEAR